MTEKKEGMRTYLIKQRGNQARKITIPESWKVTYGALHGGAGRGSGMDGNVLRIYETKEKQRAIFTEVTSFLDLSIPVQKLVYDEEDVRKVMNEKGVKKSEAQSMVTMKWVDETPFDDDDF